MTALVCVRLVGSGELREVEPGNPVVLARDVYEADRGHSIFGFSSDYLARTSALQWAATCPSEAAYVLEQDDSDNYGGFRWVLSDLVGAPRDLISTIPAPASEPELRMAEELGGRPWGAPRREVRS